MEEAFILLLIVGCIVLGLKVRKEDAERARRILAREGLGDTTKAIVEREGCVLFPVAISLSEDLLQNVRGETIEWDFPDKISREDPIEGIRRVAKLPDNLKLHVPEKWERFGDVLVVRLPHELDAHESAVAEAYAEILGVKSVLRDTGGVTGEFRTPVVRTLLGSDTVTVHRENGVLFKFDAAKIMFCSGNTDERVRASKITCDDELIVDMFAGIGYFSVPIAVYQKPRRVIACELNPEAYRYLVENIELNSVGGTVEPVLRDNRDLEGESIADRVFMGYVKTTHEYLRTAIRLVRDGGVIYYHETCPCELLPDRPIERLESAAGEGGFELLSLRQVKSYSPGVSHVVAEAKILKGG
ncbi:MAG: class I SAM-dependent methyltransferase family protein [Thermoplasmata archaeon]|nr:class I SAM-dependent methyltransferase family protein [Thermoplasmata archaeon]